MLIKPVQWLMTALALLGFLSASFLPAAHAIDYGFAPVSGQLTSNFGWRTDPINGGQRFHGGIDIAASQGVPVYAPQAGVVAYSGYYGGYGNVVVLNHGNTLYTLYGHNSKLLVNAGDTVYRGQAISNVGSTGRSTGPHLHFEVHYNGQYMNPLSYLGYLQPQGGKILAQTPQSTTAYQAHQAVGGPSIAAAKSAGTRKTSRKRYPRKAYGTKVVEVVNGTDIKTVEF
ncbi:MAG TPA: M23 family metallopeptidase [Coleofasciculaceae cyanobacterium]|jgi:murein DD-endopeptidase MepM/ murein hydrolase activator NlpD